MITYHLETWESYYNDPARAGLWNEHWEEMAPAHERRMPLGMDVASYRAFDAAGALIVVTVRSTGRLVGYCLVLVKRHLHYPILCGFEDVYFLTRSERKGMVGYKMIKFVIQVVRARGCKRLYWMTKCFNTIELLLLRLKMIKLDVVYGLWLED